MKSSRFMWFVALSLLLGGLDCPAVIARGPSVAVEVIHSNTEVDVQCHLVPIAHLSPIIQSWPHKHLSEIITYSRVQTQMQNARAVVNTIEPITYFLLIGFPDEDPSIHTFGSRDDRKHRTWSIPL